MLKFTCSECGRNRLEEVMVDVVQYSEITDIADELSEFGVASVDYGKHNTDGGEIECYQCMDCGFVISSKEGGDVNTPEELVKWIKENCPQD